MFWRKHKRPSAPPVEEQELFVEWLLRYGTDFELFREIYKRNIEKYVFINKDAVLKELRKYPDGDSLSDRLDEICLFYQEKFMPIIKKAGGILFLSAEVQASAVILQIKITVFHYILKYKYENKIVSEFEKSFEELEDIYSS